MVRMKYRRRGVLAALFLSAAVLAIGRPAAAAPDLAPGETVLPDGLTAMIRHATASGAVALEVWIRCPSDGWTSTQPGIARLTALSLVSSRAGGVSLRDVVAARGGRIAVSVFQTATEIAILAPANAATELEDALLRTVFHPAIDDAGFNDAGARLAGEQVDAGSSTAEVLRGRVFSSVYAAGPLRGSTFGDATFLTSAKIEDVRSFANASYVAADAAFVAVGNADPDALRARLMADAPPQSAVHPLPPSTIASVPSAPIAIASSTVDVPGVALAWAGPPIDDQRAATAMDFLSDYLADPDAGVFAHAASSASAFATTEGQFVTLRDPGLFFVSAMGTDVDPATMEKALRDALAPLLAQPLDGGRFATALSAYQTRLLRQMDAPEGLADNYGWYFVQGASSYAPSATDASLGGAYFADAASLTPEFVRDVARKYLGVAPVVITVKPAKASVGASAGGV